MDKEEIIYSYATLEFLRKELLYDISNRAYIIGDSLGDDKEHAKHQLIDIVQDGNIDYVARMLDKAHAECAEFLYSCTKVPCETDVKYDDDQQDIEKYIITMSVHNGISETTLNLLTKLIHEYMVLKVLGGFLLMVGLSSAYGKDEIENIENQIRTRLNARINRVRRGQHPF